MQEEKETNINQLDPYKYPFPAPHTPFSLEGHWQPWYDDRRDYNTNAPTYYDYLSNFNKILTDIVELLNRVARRNITVEDTNCVDLTKINDWIDEGNPCKTYHDVITLKADVILSTYQQAITFDGNDYILDNIIQCLEDGLFVPDYMNLLNHLKDKLNQEIQDRIDGDNELKNYIDQKVEELNQTIINQGNSLTSEIERLETAIQKIVTNLYEGGNSSSNDVNNFSINNHIAAGNINLYGGTADGSTLIRTHTGQAENDITVGAQS